MIRTIAMIVSIIFFSECEFVMGSSFCSQLDYYFKITCFAKVMLWGLTLLPRLLSSRSSSAINPRYLFKYDHKAESWDLGELG